MLIDELKKKINDFEIENKNLFNEADSIKEQLIIEIKLYTPSEIKNFIENEVKKKPEKTKELGKEKLSAMKQDLNSLLENLDEKIDKIMSKNEYWIHIEKQKSTKPSYQNSRDTKDYISNGIREILGLGGKILINYKYCEARSSYDRNHYGDWCYNYEDPKTIRYCYGLTLNTKINELLKKYSEIVENIFKNNNELDNLIKQLNEQEAINLWKEV